MRLRGKLRGFKRRLSYRYFDYVAREARQLSPLSGNPDANFLLVSMLCHRDVTQYLLAVHSFCRYLRPSRFVVINDGSLTAADIQLLSRQLNPAQILEGREFQHSRLPSYSSWQRIQAIASLVQAHYVIQMDADILFLADIPEVRRAVSSMQPFMLGTDEGERLVSAEEAIRFARQFYDEGERHVQCLCEVNLDSLQGYSSMHYVRACAGFSGFPQGSFHQQQLLDISDSYSERLGAEWPVWGSEQATSNILLANMPGVTVLPRNRYDSVNHYTDTLSMVHFIGSHRFDGGVYLQLASEFLKAIAEARRA